MHEESCYSSLNFDPERVLDRCNQIFDNPGTMIGNVVIDNGQIVGMMGGYIAPYDYGDDMIASDILVYVTPDYRGSTAFIKLIRAYVAWALPLAKLVFLTQTTGINPDVVSDLYQRLGFRPVGANHCLETM